MKTLSFPGLNINGIKLDSTAFSILGRDVAWYGVIICIGMVLAFLYGLHRCKKEGVKSDDFYDLVLITVPVAIIFARLYYVVFDPTPNYSSFIDVIAIWNGGIAIYGAIIGGAIAVMVTAKFKKQPLLLFGDIMAPCVMIGQIVGRWGNFVNVEAYGSVTSLPWRMCSPSIAGELSRKALITAEEYQAILDGTLGVHPTFLYESLWNLLGLALLHFLVAKRKRYNGQLMFFWLAWYGFGRMLIEPLRTDSLRLGSFDVSTLVGVICFAVFTALYIIFLKKEKNNGTDN
ncbi:MAG: prolipoprotein diacylglyceryl transferase [Clostridia bacterium]|nr:prolipoprotein diacylglyceryl transferase [Clostridia bacterium]